MRVWRAAVGTRAIFFVKHCRTTADSEQMREAISSFSRTGVQNTVPDSRVSHAGLDVAAASAGFGEGREGAPQTWTRPEGPGVGRTARCWSAKQRGDVT